MAADYTDRQTVPLDLERVTRIRELEREVARLTAERDHYMRICEGDPRGAEPELREALAAALDCLERLVTLKDGPRDAAYEAAKPKAWEKARAVLSRLGRGGPQ